MAQCAETSFATRDWGRARRTWARRIGNLNQSNSQELRGLTAPVKLVPCFKCPTRGVTVQIRQRQAIARLAVRNLGGTQALVV